MADDKHAPSDITASCETAVQDALERSSRQTALIEHIERMRRDIVRRKISNNTYYTDGSDRRDYDRLSRLEKSLEALDVQDHPDQPAWGDAA